MLALRFEGWFQCRLATNPDPSDEPRGISGSTFAVAGEPDLDGIIRLQRPVAPRSHAPAVGVRVVEVRVDGSRDDGHRLLGAQVDLPGGPRFEERNGIIAKPGEAAIDPFAIEITVDGIVIRREDLWDQRQPALRAHQIPPALLRRRQPTHAGSGTFELASAEVADATGVADFPQHLRRRRELLEADLSVTEDPTTRTALEKRISALGRSGWLLEFRLGFRLEYAFELNGRVEAEDPGAELGGRVLTSRYWLPRWPIRFWMGGFDSDGLCAFMRGTLEIPFARQGSQP
jgi:hypothetical protein